jgi:Holliday junction resolvase-like predicted endonuclease
VIKDSDSYLKFVFITGVTKFNKVSIFSGLNQLQDITLNPKYSAICGYEEKDLEKVFVEELEDVNIEKMRYWYNGYNWGGESVYNPYDVLLFFESKMFKPYWFATGTPDFLMKLIKNRRYFIPNLENIELSDSILDSFDIDSIEIENLLFQTGYLTIDKVVEKGDRRYYLMKYPNYEVRVSFNEHLLKYLTGGINRVRTLHKVGDILYEGNLELLEEELKSLYASIPYEWYVNNRMNEYEGYYASVFYALMAGLGMKVNVEESTNKGRIDLVLENEKRIYIVEFKIIKNESEKGSAIKQILEKKYYEKFLSNKKEIYLIGVEFDEKEKNISSVNYQKVE